MTKMARVAAVAVALLIAFVSTPPAHAQDVDRIVSDLESRGWYIEPGGEGSGEAFDVLVRTAQTSPNTWYFVSMAGPVEQDFADVVRDDVRPTGNVIVYFVEVFGDEVFANVQLASGADDSVDDRALAPFEGDWDTPDELMAEIVIEFDRLTESSSGSTDAGSTGSGDTPPPSGTDSGGSGLGWLVIAVPVVLIVGAVWLSSRNRRKKQQAEGLDVARRLRAQIQTELDELANDVLVLSGPIDLCDDPDAVQHYREAAGTYTAISDEIPDLDQLENADLAELVDLGARVAHARWQMDAAEAIIDGEPVPDKPEVEPPPPPPVPEKPAPAPRLPQRTPRPRTPYSPSRRGGRGGGLLDILIGGAGMAGRGSRRPGGGLFGGERDRGSSGPVRRSTGSSSGPRPGGGVFGSSRSSSNRRRSTSRSRTRSSSRSRSRSRSSSSRRSSSRRRRR